MDSVSVSMLQKAHIVVFSSCQSLLHLFSTRTVLVMVLVRSKFCLGAFWESANILKGMRSKCCVTEVGLFPLKCSIEMLAFLTLCLWMCSRENSRLFTHRPPAHRSACWVIWIFLFTVSKDITPANLYFYVFCYKKWTKNNVSEKKQISPTL